MTFWGHKLGQTDHESHRDLWGNKVGHGNLWCPRDLLGHKLGQTDHKGHHDNWGRKVGHDDF